MDNPRQIVTGFTNLAKSKLGIAAEQLEQHAIERLNKCKACEFFSISSTCNKCGCFMPAKVRVSEAKCPAGKW